MLGSRLPFRLLDHGRQLVQIADHQQLHPAKGQLGAAVAPQDAVDAVEQIGPDHADLVDHQEIEALDDVAFSPC